MMSPRRIEPDEPVPHDSESIMSRNAFRYRLELETGSGQLADLVIVCIVDEGEVS